MEFLVALMVGFLAHRLEMPIERMFPDPDTNRLARYGIGRIIVLGVFALIAPRRAVGTLAAVVLGTGVGVVLGYVEDGLRR